MICRYAGARAPGRIQQFSLQLPSTLVCYGRLAVLNKLANLRIDQNKSGTTAFTPGNFSVFQPFSLIQRLTVV